MVCLLLVLLISGPGRAMAAETATPSECKALQAKYPQLKGKTLTNAINPHTPVDVVRHVLDETDLVLAMTVNPGFGGQGYIRAVEPKIRALRGLIDDHGGQIELVVA